MDSRSSRRKFLKAAVAGATAALVDSTPTAFAQSPRPAAPTNLRLGADGPRRSPLEDKVHPRIFLVPDGYSNSYFSVSQVKANIAAHDAVEFQAYINYWTAAQAWSNADRTSYPFIGAPSELFYDALAYAFLYQTYNAAAFTYGGHSRDEIAAKASGCIERAVQSPQRGTIDAHFDAAGGPGVALTVAACDWMWNILSAQTRSAIAAWLTAPHPVENEWDRERQIGSVGQSNGSAARSFYLLVALLLAGEGLADSWTQTSIDQYYAMFRHPTRGFVGVQSSFGAILEGMLYDGAYTIRNLQAAEEAYRTARNIGFGEHYGSDDAYILRHVGESRCCWYINQAEPRTPDSYYPDGHALVLWKGEKIGVCDSHRANHRGSLFALSACWGLMAHVDRNAAAAARWAFDRHGQTPAYYRSAYQVPARFIWCSAPAAQAVPSSAESVALSYREKQGIWRFRSSWTPNIDEPVVVFRAVDWAANRNSNHLPGHFEVYRKGPAVVGRGGISGHDHIGTTGSGNVMFFPNAAVSYLDIPSLSYRGSDNELTAAVQGGHPRGVNMGGVVTHAGGLADSATSWISESSRDYRGETREFLSSASGRPVDYVFRDLTRYYASTAPNSLSYYDPEPHISHYVRQLVYWRGANSRSDSVRIVVFDRATVTDAKFEKRWVMSMPAQPVFEDGSTAPGPSRGPTGTGGKTFSTDCTLVTATQTMESDIKVWWTPLRPLNRALVRIGGAGTGGSFVGGSGYDAWSKHSSSDSHEWEDAYGVMTMGINPSGVSWPACVKRWAVEWRVESVSGSANLTDVFLNVVEVSDHDAPQSPTSEVPGAGFVGCRCGDAITVFAADQDRAVKGSFTIPIAGEFKVLICGLQPNTTRTLKPDATGRIDALAAGVASPQPTGASGTCYATIVSSGSCMVAVS